MNRFEREELAELILRAISTGREEQTALLTVPCDMGEWTRTADAASDARRELWKALYAMEIEEAEGSPSRSVKVLSRGKESGQA